jgi:hypothetical protein
LREQFRALADLPLGDRVARWAVFFLDRGEATYVFGDAPGGYVHEGRLVDDLATDCVLFLSRIVELATSRSPEEAIDRALELRFPGCPPGELVTDRGLDFAHASRLRYGEDMIASGGYGTIVTEEAGTTEDDRGTGRYPRGAVAFVRTGQVQEATLRNGDLAFFVLNPNHEGARRAREETGAVIGHMGIIERRGGTVHLVHAALRALPGVYEGNRIVSVPLSTYLERVDRFAGLVLTRLTPERRTPEGPRSATS